MSDIFQTEQEVASAQDTVRLEDFETAVGILLQRLTEAGVVGQQWRHRAAEHVARKLDLHFREGPKITTEQQVMAALKGVGQELVAASQALGKAAERLKAAGKIMPAQEAYLAGKRAAKAAQGIGG